VVRRLRLQRRRPIGTDLALTDVIDRRWVLPSDTYETLLHVSDHDGVPMLTITTAAHLQPSAPSAAYLGTMLDGLAETFGWSVDQRVDYLLRAPGVVPAWTAPALVGMCADI
jgi:hypothetical protein